MTLAFRRDALLPGDVLLVRSHHAESRLIRRAIDAMRDPDLPPCWPSHVALVLRGWMAGDAAPLFNRATPLEDYERRMNLIAGNPDHVEVRVLRLIHGWSAGAGARAADRWCAGVCGRLYDVLEYPWFVACCIDPALGRNKVRPGIPSLFTCGTGVNFAWGDPCGNPAATPYTFQKRVDGPGPRAFRDITAETVEEQREGKLL